MAHLKYREEKEGEVTKANTVPKDNLFLKKVTAAPTSTRGLQHLLQAMSTINLPPLMKLRRKLLKLFYIGIYPSGHFDMGGQA